MPRREIPKATGVFEKIPALVSGGSDTAMRANSIVRRSAGVRTPLIYTSFARPRC